MQAAMLLFESESHSFSLFDSLLSVKMQIGIMVPGTQSRCLDFTEPASSKRMLYVPSDMLCTYARLLDPCRFSEFHLWLDSNNGKTKTQKLTPIPYLP